MVPIRTYIFKRAQGAWRVRWKDPGSGRWRSISGGRNENEAKIIEARVRQALLRDEDPAATGRQEEGPTVAQVIEVFLAHSRYLSGTEKWRYEVEMKIDNDIRPRLGKLRFADLDSERVYKFYLRLKERKLTHATIEKYHQQLGIIGDVYAEVTPGAENPIRRIRDFRKRFPKQAPSRDINFLTLEELRKLFAVADRSRGMFLGRFARFQATTGLRRSEALNLKWTDIDEASRQIHVRKSKTGKSRTVPMEPEAWEAIRGLKGHGEFVFTRFDGHRYHADSLLKPLQRAARRAGIKKRIDIHTLRHSYGSNKLRQGWGLKKVSVLLGHADISTTANIYAHLLDGDLRVRDDARLDFDKREKAQQSGESGEGDEVMAQKLANAITESLARSSDGRRALAGLLRSLTDASSLLGTRETANSREDSRESPRTSKSRAHAPLMLHPSGKEASETISTAGLKRMIYPFIQEAKGGLELEPMTRLLEFHTVNTNRQGLAGLLRGLE